MKCPHCNKPMDADEVGLLRELDVIGDRARGITGLFPVSRSHWRQGVREGCYPKPFKLAGKNISLWKRSEIVAMLQKIAEG